MFKNFHKWSIIDAFIVTLFGIATSCAPDLQPVPEPVRPAYYTLSAGETRQHLTPMMSRTPVLVKWKYTDGSTTEAEEFDGWSIGGRASFVMLESTTMSQCMFDFDEDGAVDFQQKICGLDAIEEEL